MGKLHSVDELALRHDGHPGTPWAAEPRNGPAPTRRSPRPARTRHAGRSGNRGRIRVADDVGVDGRVRQRLAQLLDVVDGDRLVEVAEHTEPRRRKGRRVVDQRRELREAAVTIPPP